MPACLPNLVADINHFERIQRLATRLVTGIRHLPYEERLQRRRLRTDLVTAFKIFTGLLGIDPNSLPLDEAKEGTSTRYSKVRTTAEGKGRHFRWALWNTGISSRAPSLQLLLPMLSRNVWRKFWQKSFPISSIDWILVSSFPYYPPSHLCTFH